jgi:hypothetical protein
LGVEVEEAGRVLEQYRKSLNEDLARRSSFVTLLTECILSQEQIINQSTKTLEECVQQINKIDALKKTFKVRKDENCNVICYCPFCE